MSFGKEAIGLKALKLAENVDTIICNSVSYPRVEFRLRRRRSLPPEKALISGVFRLLPLPHALLLLRSIISTHKFLDKGLSRQRVIEQQWVVLGLYVARSVI